MIKHLPDVWLVEDSPADTVIIEEMLAGYCSTKAFVRISDVLHALQTTTPGCLLLDLSLPDSQGLEGLEAIQLHNPFLPIVILTGMHDMELALQAINQGAEDFLVKNMLSEELLYKTVTFAAERSRLKKELLKTNEELTQSKRRVEDLTYALTHDIRSPLSNLRICMKLISEHQIAHTEVEKLLGIMQKSLAQMNSTIEGFNEVLQVNERTNDLREWVEVRDLWHNLKKYYTEHLYDIDVTFNESFKQPRLFFTPFILRSILQNLLSNSIKYRDHQKPLHIGLELYKEKDKSMLIFSDNGIGMDMNKVGKKLFEPFSRFHTSLEIEGTGIGLYIIKAMIEVQGGSILVTSEEGKGTTFKITFEDLQENELSLKGQA
ncbi:ATP-binding protein [Roseivirga sp. BDSF3-8]|uniref:ATP-binding protein n=1 Tax=Roseivirga sp. BDSF3-8 TaxID=3241598 RepID=UPI0035319037